MNNEDQQMSQAVKAMETTFGGCMGCLLAFFVVASLAFAFFSLTSRS